MLKWETNAAGKERMFIRDFMSVKAYEGVLVIPYPDQEGNKLQRPNSGLIQHTPHEAQYTS